MADPIRFKPHVTAKRFEKLAYGTLNQSGLAQEWVGLDLSSDYEAQMQMAEHARQLLGVDVLVNTVHASLGPLFAGTIRLDALEFLCWRLAANTDLLTTDRAVPVWEGLRETAVVPVQVVRATFGYSLGKQPRLGSQLTFRIIDGPLCPVRFSRWFPKKFLFVIARDIGISSYRARASFSGNHNQLYGMRFVAQIGPSSFDRSAINIERHMVGQFEAYNRKLMRLRANPCPLEYSWPCHTCSIGEDKCPESLRACRPTTLQSIRCAVCGQDTWHDVGKCLRCAKRPTAVTSGGYDG